MRIIELRYNMATNRLVTSTGADLSQQDWPQIFYKENPLLRLQLVDADNNDYTDLADVAAMTANIDKDYNHTTDLMAKTTNDGINVAGDWTSGGTADISQGQVSIRLDANTTSFAAALSTNSQLLNSRLELQFYDSTPTFIGAISFTITAKNLQDAGEDTPPEVTSDYWTKTQADAKFVDKDNINTDSCSVPNDAERDTGFSEFYGLFVVTCESLAACGPFIAQGSSVFPLGASAEFSTVQDNAGTINVYFSGGHLTVQNKTGGAITASTMIINPGA